MDGTLVPTPTKQGGSYRPLSESAAEAPLKRWLSHGGNVCVISTAGRRMWWQVYESLHPYLLPRRANSYARSFRSIIPGTLLLSAMSGAALFRSDQNGNMVEEREYIEQAAEGGTRIDPKYIPELEVQCHLIMKNFLRMAANDPSLLPTLSKKYQVPFGVLLQRMKAVGQEKFLREEYTLAALKEPGRFFEDAALFTVQGPLGIAHDNDSVLQYGIMGVPQSRFDQLFPDSVTHEFLAKYGVQCKRQPNSVVITRSGIDKGTCISWLVKHSSRYHNFALHKAIAMGDFPKTVDYAMTQFPPMPFVSVALQPSGSDGLANVIHVGGEEDGTAAFLTEFLKVIDAEGPMEAFGKEKIHHVAKLASESRKVAHHTLTRVPRPHD